MNRVGNLVGVLAVMLLAGTLVNGQERPKRALPKAGGPLVSKDVEAKLNLTAEQKEKIAKIETEFAAKTKDVETKAKELMEKAKADKDRELYKKAAEQLAEAGKARETYQTQVQALLTAEQKKSFEQAQAGAQERRPAPSQGTGQLLPPALQERLELSAEQKEKLSKLQKEFESKAMEVLTEEQRKKVEQFKGRQGAPKPPRKQPGTTSNQSSSLPPPALTRLRAD